MAQSDLAKEQPATNSNWHDDRERTDSKLSDKDQSSARLLEGNYSLKEEWSSRKLNAGSLPQGYELNNLILTNFTSKDRPDKQSEVTPDGPLSSANDRKTLASHANRIHSALDELNTGRSSRSAAQIEQDIRDTVRTLTKGQINEVETMYRYQYGVGMIESLQRSSKISGDSKFALNVYSHGSDKISAEDSATLLTRATSSRNLSLFSEAAREAGTDTSKLWYRSGGEQMLKKSFSASDLRHAEDFVKEGRLSFLTQVKDNTGVIKATTSDAAIDLAIDRMSSADRAKFVKGMRLNSGDQTGTSRDDLEAKWYFQDVKAAFKAAGSDTRATSWENRIVNGNSSLSELTANQRGALWNGSRADLSSLVENMSEKDWQYFRDPSTARDRREKFSSLVGTLKNDAEATEIMQIFDRKTQAQTFDQSKNEGRRDVLVALNDFTHTINNDRVAALDAVTHMRSDEQNKYRTDENFRKQLDDKVKSVLGTFNAGSEGCERALKAIREGKNPPDDIITRLQKNRLSALVLNDSESAMETVEQELRKNPELRKRISEPKNAEDQKFSEDFKKAAEQTLSKKAFQTALPDLLKNGTLSPESSRDAYIGTSEKMIESLAHASAADRARLQNDAAYQHKILRSMSDTERKVALSAAGQGEFRAEDKMRLATLTKDESKINAVLRDLKPDQITSFQSNYQKKYGEKLDNRLPDLLNKQDLADARRVLSSNLSEQERYDRDRDQQYNLNSQWSTYLAEKVGMSRSVDQANDVLGDQTDAMRRLNAGVKSTATDFEKLHQNSRDAQLNVRAAQDTAADLASDAAAAAAAAVVIIGSGGMATPVVALAGGLAGASKIATKAALQSGEYDNRSTSMRSDFVVGAITGVTAMIGPGEVANMSRAIGLSALRGGKSGLGALADGIAARTLTENPKAHVIAGAVGGGMAKGGIAAYNYDHSKSFVDNLENIATRTALGAAGGGAGSGAIFAATLGGRSIFNKFAVAQRAVRQAEDVAAHPTMTNPDVLPRPDGINFTVHGQIDRKFFNAISNHMDALPVNIRKLLGAKKAKVSLGEVLSDIEPLWKNEKLPNGKPIDEYAAVYSEAHRAVMYGQKAYNAESPGRQAAAIRHEGGHQLEHYLGGENKNWGSYSKEYADAYARDIGRQKSMPEVPKSSEKGFAYYTGNPLKEGESDGPKEVFAELTAMRLGGGADTKEVNELLKARFPEVWLLVKRDIDRLY